MREEFDGILNPEWEVNLHSPNGNFDPIAVLRVEDEPSEIYCIYCNEPTKTVEFHEKKPEATFFCSVCHKCKREYATTAQMDIFLKQKRIGVRDE